jgi:anti-sigma B factor antagonist
MRALSISTGALGLDLTLRGQIDFAQASDIAATIREAVERTRPETVRVDLAAVTFLDSSGIGVLVTAMRAAQRVRASYRVEHPSRKVYDQLRIAGLLEAFGVLPATADG